MTIIRLAVAAVLLFSAVAADAQDFGQYFGRNKVRYREFNFKVLTSEHFLVYYYGEKHRANTAAQMLERWHNRFVKIFHFPLRRQPVILYETPGDFEQTNVIGGLIPQGVGGVTESEARRICVTLTGINAADDHVLGHELVHAFQFAALQQRKDRNAQQSLSVPTWFVEGMAEYLSIGGSDAFTTMWMRDAVLNKKIPTIAQAGDESSYFPYRFGHAIWASLTGWYGDSSIAVLFDAVTKTGWKRAYPATLGIPFDSLSKKWQATMKSAFAVNPAERDTGIRIGKPLITGQGGYNLGPSLSPDGASLVYISARDLFGFELYLADAATGRILKKLTSSIRSQRFEEINYINSAGAWSPDGSRFAMTVYEKGKNTIAIFDMGKREIDRVIAFPGVNAIYQLAWSPHGDALAFFGTQNGWGGLFRYSFSDGRIQALTGDGHSDIQPAWSPDGKTIVFSTDRGPATSTDSLAFGPQRIGFLDVNTGVISTIALSEKANHLNPQYSPDGQSIYFVADPDGIPNLYRYDLSSRQFFKVTNVATGVSGLTGLSPAFSVAARSGKIVFNCFEKGTYGIYAARDSLCRGTPWPAADSARYAPNAGLPPCGGGRIVSAYLRDNATGRPDTNRFTAKPYKPKITSITQGQAYGGAGVAPGYGGVAVGGAYMLLSDELNDHQLGIGLQMNGDFQSLGGQVAYMNQTRRINWGASISHIPYYYVTRNGSHDTTIFIDTVRTRGIIDSLDWTRLFDDEVRVFAQYPFSVNRRLELSAGMVRYGFKTTREKYFTDTLDNVYSYPSQTVPTATGLGSALTMFSCRCAYVGDYSHYGFTGPISGKSYHFEVAPTLGTLRYTTLIADYRYYWFLRPLTLAFRALHVGGYGSDADRNPFNEFYVGYPTLMRIRGNISYLDESDSILLGSRIAVGNIEARFPFFGTRQFGLIDFKYLPLDLLAFFDGGLAWNGSSGPVWKLSKTASGRVPLFSTGLGVRFNLFGALIAEIDAVYPLQQPGRKWNVCWNISPGW